MIAQTTAVTPGTINNNSFSGTYELGFSFTANSAITVTNLGAYDYMSDGLSASHTVSIWTSSGTLLGSVTIPGGTPNPSGGLFIYSAVTPIDLTSGASYVVGASDYGPSDAYGVDVTRTVAPQITFNTSLLSDTSGNPMASVVPANGDAPNGLYGANFLFTSAAPEPSSWALIILGAGMAGGVLRWKRRLERGQIGAIAV